MTDAKKNENSKAAVAELLGSAGSCRSGSRGWRGMVLVARTATGA